MSAPADRCMLSFSTWTAGEPRCAIGTYDAIIEVRVGVPERTAGSIESNWQRLWVAILAPLAGWVFHWRRGRPGKDAAAPREPERYEGGELGPC